MSTNNIGGTWYDIVTLHTNNPVAIALGSEPLKAEESENLSLGLVLTPAEGLYVTIDAYQIKVTDRITLSENLTSPGVRIFVQSHAGYEGASGARYFTNAIDTTTQGVDIVGTYKWALANSALDFTAGYNYNKTEIDRVAPNPASLTAIDPTALRFGRVELARFEVGAPRDKFFLNNVWTRGGFSISTTATRYGEFTILNSNPVLDQTFGAKWLFDLAFSYKTNGWEFTVGGDNVLDEYPDENLYISPALNTSTTGQLPYPSQSPFGFNGAYMYARIGYKW